MDSLTYYLSCSIEHVHLVGWGSRIRRLDLFRLVRFSPRECPLYNSKPSDGEKE